MIIISFESRTIVQQSVGCKKKIKMLFQFYQYYYFSKIFVQMDHLNQQQIVNTPKAENKEIYCQDNEGQWSLQNCIYINDGYYCYQLDCNRYESQKFTIYSNTYRILRKYKQWREKKQVKEQQNQPSLTQKNKPLLTQNNNQENLKNIQQNLDNYKNQSLQNIAEDNKKTQQLMKNKNQVSNNKTQLHLYSLYSMKIQVPKQSQGIYEQISTSAQFFYKSTSNIPNQFLNDFNDQIPESTLSFLQSQRQNEDRLNEQIAYLRQQNMYLKEELSEVRNNHEQLLKQNSKAEISLTNDQINGLIQQINSYSNQIIKLQAEKQTILRENGILAQNLQQIGRSNDELHKRLSLNVRQIQRERKQNKKNMKDFEQRFSTFMQGQRQKFYNLQQELTQTREELQSSNKFVSQCEKEINRLNKTLKDLEEQYESLMSEKDQLLSFLQSSNKGQQQQQQIQQLLQNKQHQIQQLREQLFAMEGEVQKYRKQAEQYQQKYEKQLQLRQQQLQIIQNLEKQVQILKKVIQDKQASLVFQFTNTHYNKKKGMRNRSVEGISTCSASTINRVKVLCNEPTRKTIMGELRKLMRQIGNIQLENKICALVQELYMDAEYRERSCIKLQEIIGQLEDRIQRLQTKKEIPVQQNPSKAYLQQLQQSINRYERLLRGAEGQKMKLMEEVTALRKENHQIRLELADSDLDNQTQRLIEQLTLQLQREKYSARELEEQNEAYHNEIVCLQKELYQKNKRLKLLGLNLNRKQGGQDIEVNVL